MTIIIGLICKDSIVLASDSQTTFTSFGGSAQQLDTPKISVLEFSGTTALVAQSGNATLSGRAVEILSSLSKGQPVSDYRSVADRAQKAIVRVKQELREQNLNCSMEELREYIRRNDLDFELMIAHYHDKKPNIFTIDFDVGIAARRPHLFTAIGRGSEVANYILSWFNIGSEMPHEHGMLASIYTIEEVKKVDSFCGGATKIAVLSSGVVKDAEESNFTASEVVKWMLAIEHNGYVDALAKIDKKAKFEWASKMDAILTEVHQENLEKLNARVRSRLVGALNR